tara:strand:- start:547 stop:1041 length:495 start_codon:yes stop_codon:yes gene_type:complete
MKNAVWTDKTIKTIWDWGSNWYLSKDDVWAIHFGISDFEDFNLVELIVGGGMDISDESLNSYLEYNGHADYLGENGQELLEEQVQFELNGVSTRLYGISFLAFNCMKEQMGKGKTPVHPVEIYMMRKLAWYLTIIQGNSGVNAEINSKELEEASSDFYERFDLL